jgi:cytochrome c oxidase cbb3-type subunit III
MPTVKCRQFAALALAFLALGCSISFPGKPDPKDRPVPADKVVAFDKLFSTNCAGCHGKDGKLGPAPPLNDPLFRAIVPTTALEMVLSNGRSGTPMPAFAHGNGGPLTPAQVQVLIYEIQGVRYRIDEKRDAINTGRFGSVLEVTPDAKGIAPSWGAVESVASEPPPYLLPETKGSAEHGAQAFSRACAGCHGVNGEGKTQDGRQVKKIHDQVFLSLISDQALRRIIITGRPDLKMPNFAQRNGRPDDFQPLTSSEIADLVALLGSWREGKTVSAK